MSDGHTGNGYEREQRQADADQYGPGVMRLFGQMVMLPFTVFVYGMGLFVRTIQGMQRAADQGMDVMAGASQPPSGGSSNNPAGGAAGSSRAQAPSGWADLKIQTQTQTSTSTSTSDGPADKAAEVNRKETGKMRDKDLSDDQLKLVRYKILFVKRDYEVAFPEQEELVHDNITGDAFAAWKVAEFIQQLHRGHTPVPHGWLHGSGGDTPPTYPSAEHGGREYVRHGDHGWVLLGFPESDKKYLRVYYEVLERYVREEEDSQVGVLKDIRKAIDRLPRISYGSGTGTGTGTGGTGGGAGGAGGSGGGGGYGGGGGTSGGGTSGGGSGGSGGGGVSDGGTSGGGRGYNS
ncbi:MAG TPA: hypothetical protein VM936_08420 [Pyrinomonadaceae bacterium]|jgi:hypothetical protein|nr:hypothetical protein [Pyrinomonadaceae bacterium]